MRVQFRWPIIIDIIHKSMKQLKVVQFEGLAPSVFCGLYFADQGAEVTLVARAESMPVSVPINKNILNRNKKCITINIKDKQHFQIVTKLLSDADILIDPYRPGVLEKLKLGPKELYQINKRIILLRVSGYGQGTPSALRPGHDLNYISSSGIVPLINKKGENQFPANYLADFVSASLGITGTLAALHERERTGLGKVVDCSLADGCIYLAQNIQANKSPGEDKQLSIRQTKINGKTFIYNTKDGKVIEETKLEQLLKGREYYRCSNGDIEISLVKDIEPFQGGILKNPFSNLQLPNKIKRKGEDDEQIFAKIRAKL